MLFSTAIHTEGKNVTIKLPGKAKVENKEKIDQDEGENEKPDRLKDSHSRNILMALNSKLN